MQSAGVAYRQDSIGNLAMHDASGNAGRARSGELESAARLPTHAECAPTRHQGDMAIVEKDDPWLRRLPHP